MCCGKKITTLFIIIWVALFAIFAVFDYIFANEALSAVFKFLLVVDCFFISLVNNMLKEEKLLKAAFLFTVAADFCIVIMPWYFSGVCIFCIVQILYFMRYTENVKKIYLHLLFSFIALSVWLISGNALMAVSSFYAFCLIASVISSFCARKKYIFAVSGMVLFLFCDICVFLFNLYRLAGHSDIINKISAAAVSFIWLFYAPSQLLLSLSKQPNKLTKF